MCHLFEMTQSHQFTGQVKYTSLVKGTIAWKSGHLALVKDDRGWKVDLVLAVTPNGRPALTTRVTKQTIIKTRCNSNSAHLDVKIDRCPVTITFKSEWQGITKQFVDTLNNILEEDAQETVTKSEVCIIDDAPNKFTSVKEIKRDKLDEERKENLGIPLKSEDFLQRGMEKAWLNTSSHTSNRFYGSKSGYSPKPLFSSTPSKQNQSSEKRKPGLMPDPTPTKKSRLSSLIPNYSMKTKLFSNSEDHKTQDKTQAQSGQPGFQGFSNLGNTCYMNAILQSLFGLDTFATDLICNRRLLRYVSNQSLYNAMCKLLNTKRQLTSTDISKRESLRRVKSAISNSAKRFSGYGQHDAHEFLGQVLDQLKEEIVKITKSTPSPSRDGEIKFDRVPDTLVESVNPVTDNFEFEILHAIACENCSHQLTKTEQFHDISLDVPRRRDIMTPRSLQDALSQFFRNEKFEYKCENCGHDKSDVSHKITRLPRVFILHLKRYTYNQMFSKNTKMGQNVTVPLYLTLQRHCTDETQPAFPPNFNTSVSDQKSLLEDSSNEEDVPSRRKLDYKSESKDKCVGSDNSSGDHSYYTETKDKKEEDSDIARAIEMSLKDFENEQKDDADDDIARAIEMSLQEHARETEISKDVFGDDNDSDFEKAIEMSRQDHNYDSWTQNVEDKENKDPTEDRPRLSDPHEVFGEQSDSSVDEVDGHVEESLHLPEIKNEKGELPYSYRLVSIVNHMGISSATGHYLSDVYDMKKKCWHSYDDTHVLPIPESEVLSRRERSGYIFFYMNKETFNDIILENSLKT